MPVKKDRDRLAGNAPAAASTSAATSQILRFAAANDVFCKLLQIKAARFGGSPQLEGRWLENRSLGCSPRATQLRTTSSPN